MNYFNRHGHLTDEGLSLYAEALKLDRLDQLPIEVLAHVEQCPECESQVGVIYSLIAEMDMDELGPHPSLEDKTETNSTAKSRFRDGGRKLAILLLAGMAYYFYQASDGQPLTENNEPSEANVEQKIEAGDSLQQIESLEEPEFIPPPANNATDTEPQPIAGNFTPSDNLESLIGEIVRSDNLEIISPNENISVRPGEQINFSWSTSLEEALFLIIVDNEENEIQEIEIDSSNYTYIVNQEPGLYYWKLESEEDLLYVGKFKVEHLGK